MFEKNEIFRIAGIILAYLVTFAGIIALPFVFAVPRSWWLGLFLVVAFIPLFPAIQTILLGQKPVSLPMFARIYVAEFASLVMQLLLLAVSAPIIAVAVAGMIPMMMLAATVLMWPVVGLQQLGIEIGSKMSTHDIKYLFWVTLGSALLSGIYILLRKLAQKYEDNYFDIWAKAFRKVRDFFQ